MADTVAVDAVTTGRDGHWSHIFQGANTQWLNIFEQRIFCGNFFIGLQAQSAHFYDLQIPRGAEIISAVQTVTGLVNSGAGAVNVPMNSPVRDGTSYITDPIVRPFEVYQGWRPDIWSNQDIDLVDSDLSTTLQTSAGLNNAQWILRQTTSPGGTLANRDSMGQGFTMYAGGNSAVTLAAYQMLRTGNPVGSVRVRIEGSTTINGLLQPDGVVIATSLDVAAASIPTTLTQVTFTFATAAALTPGQNYFIIIEPDYVANNADHLSVAHQNQFLTTGRLLHFGDGLGGDWQNYPGTADYNQGITSTEVSSDIVWALPQFVRNSDYSSPDISQIVQDQVNAPWYDPDSGICITQQSPNSGGNNRIWWSAAGASAPEQRPRISVTYRPRRVNIA